MIFYAFYMNLYDFIRPTLRVIVGVSVIHPLVRHRGLVSVCHPSVGHRGLCDSSVDSLSGFLCSILWLMINVSMFRLRLIGGVSCVHSSVDRRWFGDPSVVWSSGSV